MEITFRFGTRREVFILRMGKGWNGKLYCFMGHNTHWDNGDFYLRAVKEIL